ncbi:Mrx11p Ecym_2539 [Eremothecium cymbalariae DBVPG|uniref:Uncharacterized protein n=1 Tax=Eremothecium cymbalariae (strain CBS 270.75 / DBVPG 7215 / KCTC 17166 / NRRL Y-17582) TaxID=931890 RepID=G8JQA1_ERECY|nr:Hypothetical protein Ecym_2539 [Eremothecium cymbalariae DBVPG\
MLQLNKLPIIFKSYHTRPLDVIFNIGRIRLGTRVKLRNRSIQQISQYSNSINKTVVDKQLSKAHVYIKKSYILRKLYDNPRCRKYFDRLLKNGPISTVTAFLVLHEVTAVAPLLMIWYILYNLECTDLSMLPDYVNQKLTAVGSPVIEKLVKEHGQGCDKQKLITSGAIAYCIVKILYPARILLSLWAAPYFARILSLPYRRLKHFYKR